MSVGLESVFNSIISYPNSTTLKLLNARISRHLNLDINNFIFENKLDVSYEEYLKDKKNAEQYSYVMKLGILESNLKEELIQSLNKLKPIEKIVIERRYGINNEKKMTLTEIAKELSFTHQNIAKIEKRALKKLYSSNSKKLNKFL